MAARQIQRRILSLLTTSQPHTQLSRESCWKSLPSANSFFSRNELIFRKFQTHSEASKEHVKDGEGLEDGNLKPGTNSAEVISSPASETTVETSVTSNLRISSRHDLAMIFTCRVCQTRSVKTVCRESYDKGVVVARCSGCNNLHLIADRLGWFGEPGSVEEFLASRGEEVKKGSIDTLNLTLEDLAGRKLEV